MMTLLTPSHAPDLPLCRDLVHSVKKFAQGSLEHVLVVPRREMPQFRKLGVTVLAEEDFLPRTYIRPFDAKYALDLRQPTPPVRGWIRQQILKVAAASQLSSSTALLVDSDIRFIAPFGEADFLNEAGQALLYRLPGAVTKELPRHVKWHKTARILLGLPPGSAPYPDYVSSMIAWSPHVVRQMISRVEETHRRDWRRSIARHLHFSEWTLYGTYAELIAASGEAVSWTVKNRCHDYWNVEALGLKEAREFVQSRSSDDIAVMISAKSGTPLSVRRHAFEELQ